jgi:hypothetical protein
MSYTSLSRCLGYFIDIYGKKKKGLEMCF